MIRSLIWIAFVLAVLAWVARFGWENREGLLARGARLRQQITALLGQNEQQQNEQRGDVDETQATERTAGSAPPPRNSKPSAQQVRTDAHTQEASGTQGRSQALSSREAAAEGDPPPESEPSAETGPDGGLAQASRVGSEEKPWDEPEWAKPPVEEILEDAGKWLFGAEPGRR